MVVAMGATRAAGITVAAGLAEDSVAPDGTVCTALDVPRALWPESAWRKVSG